MSKTYKEKVEPEDSIDFLLDELRIEKTSNRNFN